MRLAACPYPLRPMAYPDLKSLSNRRHSPTKWSAHTLLIRRAIRYIQRMGWGSDKGPDVMRIVSGARIAAVAAAVAVASVVSAPAFAQLQGPAPVEAQSKAKTAEGGVKIKGKAWTRLLNFTDLERVGGQQYTAMVQKAGQQRALLPPDHPQSIRLRKIFNDLLPYSYKFNERAKSWQWDVNVFNSPQINAFCMPGGKIAFFTGILEKLQLTDDEVALVMGHEISHALREHAQARAGKQNLIQGGAILVSIFTGSQAAGQITGQIGGLATLKFSRDDETEADLVGMELAARAGYDPRAGVRLWEKMSAANKGAAPPQWLSTHPSGESRINTIKSHLAEVMPLYEASAKKGAPR
jgi:Zn-dependent protease with chaperone function